MGLFKKIKKKVKKAKKRFAKKHPKLGKILKKREQLRKKVGKGIVKVGKKIGSFIKSTVGWALLAPLLPFKKLMKKRLEKEGVKTSGMKFPKIVENFHKKIVKKGKNYEDFDNEFPDGFENHPLFRLPVEDYEPQDHIVADAIGGVVKGILDFIKGAKKKKAELKEAGLDVDKLMTPEEKEIAEEAEIVEKQLIQKERKSSPVGQVNEKMKSYTKYALIGVVVILAIIFIMKK